ncbi:MAG: hypothetical protein V1872_14860 [bacterium]
MKKSLIILLSYLCLTSALSLPSINTYGYNNKTSFEKNSYNQNEETSTTEKIIIDILILRPVGLASIALGTGLFIISLPFSIPTRSVKIVGKRLVKQPFEYTFERPIGNIDP